VSDPQRTGGGWNRRGDGPSRHTLAACGDETSDGTSPGDETTQTDDTDDDQDDDTDDDQDDDDN
jgi:hypothetical protein